MRQDTTSRLSGLARFTIVPDVLVARSHKRLFEKSLWLAQQVAT